MIVYKVISNGDCYGSAKQKGSLVSVIVTGQASIQYYPNVACTAPKWLADKNYHLIAFKRLKDANSFAIGESNQEIWRCEATGVSSKLPPRCFLSSLHNGKLTFTEMEDILTGASWPHGTLMCKTITLLKKVA